MKTFLYQVFREGYEKDKQLMILQTFIVITAILGWLAWLWVMKDL